MWVGEKSGPVFGATPGDGTRVIIFTTPSLLAVLFVIALGALGVRSDAWVLTCIRTCNVVISITPAVAGVNLEGVMRDEVVVTPVEVLLCDTILTALSTMSLSPHPGDLSE